MSGLARTTLLHIRAGIKDPLRTRLRTADTSRDDIVPDASVSAPASARSTRRGHAGRPPHPFEEDDVKPVKSLLVLAVAGVLAIGATPVPAPKVTEFGSGPTIVFVHGLGGSAMQWMPTARKLMTQHHVVMVDLPGHGESPMPDPFSIDQVAESLDQVLAKQNPPGAVVVGHGVGGLVGMTLLQRHPEHVRGLVLVDASARFSVPVPDQQQRLFLDFIDKNYDAFLKQMFTQLGRDSAQGVAILAQATQVPKSAMIAYFRALLNVDASGALKQPAAPVLSIASSRAWPENVTWAELARQRGYPDGAPIASRRIGDSGYWMMREQPDSLAAAISEFSGNVAGGE
jgi:pimeloyl-ACP methyl ester carboxylesterase